MTSTATPGDDAGMLRLRFRTNAGRLISRPDKVQPCGTAQQVTDGVHPFASAIGRLPRRRDPDRRKGERPGRVRRRSGYACLSALGGLVQRCAVPMGVDCDA